MKIIPADIIIVEGIFAGEYLSSLRNQTEKTQNLFTIQSNK
ncbi:hypothetical protein PGH45_00060 [Legionella pneumophila]|nr:hypothetical protein [Legionella pneumophila]